MEHQTNPPTSAHASNAQPWNIRTHWEIASGWRGHLCAAKVRGLIFRSIICALIILGGLSLVTTSAWSAGTLKVTTPNGGQKWTTGKSYAVKWSKGNAGAKVKIQLLSSGKHYKWVSKKTKNDGKLTWKIPSTVKTGSKYKIKIVSVKNKKIFDTSNKHFTISQSSSGGSKGCNLYVRVGPKAQPGVWGVSEKVKLGPRLSDSRGDVTGGCMSCLNWAPFSKGIFSGWTTSEGKRLSIWVCANRGKWANKWVKVKGPTNYCTKKFYNPTATDPYNGYKKGRHEVEIRTSWLHRYDRGYLRGDCS